MNKSDNIADLALALNEVQAVLTGAIKDSSNPFFKSNYADLESVWNSIREPLTKNGLSVSQMPSEINGQPALTTILMHSTGQFICSTVPVIVAKQDAQSYVAGFTYFRRAALAAIVGQISVDDDGNTAVQGHQTQPAKVAAPVWARPPVSVASAPKTTMPGFENHSSPTLVMFINTMKNCATLSGLSRVWEEHNEFRKSLSKPDLDMAISVKDEMKGKLK